MKDRILEKLKNTGWGFLGIGFLVVIFLIPILFIEGSVRIFAWLADHQIIKWTNSIISTLLLLLLFLSIFPRLRLFTGQGIVFLTYISGVIIWLLCLYITYILWGFLGVVAGLIFLGVGVFPTAVLALLFNSQFLLALLIMGSLVIIYGLRMFGIWISTKYQSAEDWISV